MHSDDFEDKVSFLNSTLRDSIERLLAEAKNKEALLPPYGRPPTPTPFVDEDEEIAQDDEETRNDEELDDATNFKYEYGFNPLVFLADFLHRAHPESIASRQKLQAEARARLRARVQHARNQLMTCANLKVRAGQLRSGIIHGPLTYPQSPTSILFFCRTVTAGNVAVEISAESDFSTLALQSLLPTKGPETPLKLTLGGLEPATKYFCRCWLLPEGVERENGELLTPNVAANTTTSAAGSGGGESDVPEYLAECQFWTLVKSDAVDGSNTTNNNNNNNNIKKTNSDSDEDDAHQEVELFAINGKFRQRLDEEGTGKSCFEVTGEATNRPFFSVIVGDIFDNGENGGDSEGQGDSEGAASSSPDAVDTQLWKLFRNDPLFFPLAQSSQHNSVLCMSSMLCAWNDSQIGSDTGLKAEEIVHKQWSYDTRKFEKRQKEKLEKEKKEAFEQKGGGSSFGGGAGGGPGGAVATPKKRPAVPPPVLSRPVMSQAFRLLAEELPLQYFEDNVRHLYRSVHVSADVEVFVLDSRKGYLGKEQVRWLKDGLRKSSAAMKIIFSGQPFGLHLVDCSLQQLKSGEIENVDVEEENRDNVTSIAEGDEGSGDGQPLQEDGTKDVSENENSNANPTTTEINAEVLIIDPASSGKTPTTTPKKISSSRQRSLEATKEEFDDDGLSKSSLAHALVSTHRKLYPVDEKDDEDNEDLDEYGVEPPTPLERSTSNLESDGTKLELSGGILIVSSSDTEESFAASYNFGRSPEELSTEDHFCLEVGLGRARREKGRPQVCEEKAPLTPAEALVANGRTVHYRSNNEGLTDGNQSVNVNSLACSIVVKANGVLGVSLKQVDTGDIVYEVNVSSALSN